MSTNNCTIIGAAAQTGDIGSDSFDGVVERAFAKTLDIKSRADGDELPPKRVLTGIAMTRLRKEIEGRNALLTREARWRVPKDTPPSLLGRLVMCYHHVFAIPGEGGTMMLAVYVDDPSSAEYGIYITDENRIRALIREFDGSLTRNATKEVIAYLLDVAPRRGLTVDPDLLPMADGIFDYKTKKTMPFSPEYVFLRKFPISIPDHPIDEPVITMPDGKPWRFTSWLAEVIEDEATREVVWDVLGALLRPHVNWLQIAFLIGKGRNGKGTLIELMRALVGHSNCAALSLKHFSKQTELVPLLGALANIADENDDSFIPTSELVKAIADHNAITVRRLYNDPFTFRPHMMNVQAMNDLPVFKDKSEGMHARILAIPFTKKFLRGKNDNTDVKNVYMVDPDVVQWVAYHALVERPDYYVLGSSEATDAALVSYRAETDPVAAFWTEEARENVVGCFLPYGFLYAWYVRWMREVNPSGHAVDQRKFTRRIKELAAADGWVDSGPNKLSCRSWMPSGEPHAAKYAKHRYDGSCDEDDALGRWFSSSAMPQRDRGLVLGSVDDWCADRGVKPCDFVRQHAPDPPQRVAHVTVINPQDVNMKMMSEFVRDVTDGASGSDMAYEYL